MMKSPLTSPASYQSRAATMDLQLAPVTQEGFSLVPRLSNDALIIRFSGNGDMEAVQPLKMYLKDVHVEAVRAGVSRVVFDIRELYFMNSSCFKSFVTWIVPLSALVNAPYRVEFASSSQLHWQKRSMDALQQLAPRLITITRPQLGDTL